MVVGDDEGNDYKGLTGASVLSLLVHSRGVMGAVKELCARSAPTYPHQGN